ncbi:MAG: DUF2799 domain-containing protein [Pseudomonadales bacterium]|nr:DUF2799 domain-containing protein [Pseudomonadales bacterium]
MTVLRGLFAIALLMLLASCASLSKDECLNADWHTIGFGDGTQGLAAGQIDEHRQACAKYGIAPDLEAYLAGRDQGLAQYCRTDNAWRIGVSGGQLNSVCPPELEGPFQDAWSAGHGLWSRRDALNQVESDIQSHHNQIEKIDKRITKKSADLIADDTEKEERIRLLAEIKDLNDRKNRLKVELVDLAAEREARAADLSAYEANVSSNY